MTQTTARPTTNARGPGHFLGWRIAALATITAALAGPGQTLGVAVFIDPLIADIHLTRSEVSVAYLIGTLLGAAAMLRVGPWIDSVGPRRAMTLIGLAFGAGLVVMSGVQGFVTLAVGFTLIRWLGQGSLSLVSILSITPWFERRRGLVFGISTSAAFTLMAFTPIILGLAIEAYGWRTAWILAAVAVWLIVVPIARFGIIDRPADVGQYPDGVEPPTVEEVQAPSAPSLTRRQALRQRRFLLLNLAIAATSMLGTALTFHQISILGEVGLTATEAAVMYLPLAAGAIVAGIVAGTLADRIPARFLLALMMVFSASSLLLVAFIEPGWRVLVYAVALGAAFGMVRPLVATVLPRWYGLAHIGAIQGVTAFVVVAGSALGPVALSMASDLIGGYGSATLVFVTIPLAIGLATLAITEPGAGLRSRRANPPLDRHRP